MSTNRLEMLLNMLENDPSDSFVRYALSKEYEYAGDVENAFKQYEVLMTNDPDYVGLYYHLAKLYEKSEQYEMAVSIYNQGIDVAKKLKDFHALSELNSALMNLQMEL